MPEPPQPNLFGSKKLFSPTWCLNTSKTQIVNGKSMSSCIKGLARLFNYFDEKQYFLTNCLFHSINNDKTVQKRRQLKLFKHISQQGENDSKQKNQFQMRTKQ